MTDTPPDSERARRGRLMLLGIAGLFFGSMLIAGLLLFSGWRPAGSNVHGELLEPPVDLQLMAANVPASRQGLRAGDNVGPFRRYVKRDLKLRRLVAIPDNVCRFARDARAPAPPCRRGAARIEVGPLWRRRWTCS